MALIYPNDREDAAAVARRLVEAAGPDRRGEVRTVTDGPAGVSFDVPDDVYHLAFGAAPAAAPPPPVEPADPPQMGDPAAEPSAAAPEAPAAATATAEPASSSDTDKSGAPTRQRRRSA
jgi:hypothetical protein